MSSQNAEHNVMLDSSIELSLIFHLQKSARADERPDTPHFLDADLPLNHIIVSELPAAGR